jgi:DNA-binding PadR family transcriptional regulator
MHDGRGCGKKFGTGSRRMFFLESCLLVLLCHESGYGYSLMTGLKDYGFHIDEMDISILYRALRDLESAGLVSSSWDENSLGPQRRVYTITAQGEETLAEWMQSLHKRRKEIEELETTYDAVKTSA